MVYQVMKKDQHGKVYEDRTFSEGEVYYETIKSTEPKESSTEYSFSTHRNEK
jgi:hypothetical protein